MRSINRTWCLLVALACAAAPSVQAQASCNDVTVFCYEDFVVEVNRLLPVVGEPLQVTVTSREVSTLSGTLFYRVTGTSAYTAVAVEPENGLVFTVEIPADALTVRGLDLYGELFDGSEVLTFPEEDPAENPVRLPIFLGSFRADAGLVPRTYRMVSVPADIEVQSVREILEDDLGRPDAARWRAARWQPALERYELSPDQAITSGDAFWVAAATGGAFDVDLANSTNPDSLAPIVLQPGFNQIGNPYAFPVDWADVLADGDVSLPVRYDGVSPYVEVTRLKPWEGYFVSNNEDRPVTLRVLPREAGVGREALPVSASYTVRLSGRSEAYADTLNVVGFAEGVAPSLREPPPIGDHLRVSVLGEGTSWTRSLRPTPTDGTFWEVEVTASEDLLGAPRRVTLSLAEEGARRPGFGLWVIDRDLGTGIDVDGGTFEVTLGPDAPVRRLRIIAGTESFAEAGSEGAPLEPVAFALDAGFPNPFAAQTTMRYRLARRGPATLEVFDLLGRRVRVLADAAHEAGPHTAVWDGRDGSGRLAASGVYLVRLRAAGASATRRVAVLR
ncbi:MAG: FlgD immunoglobulin-like domain containing protein [Bacteroidota bacterium]